MKWLFDPSVTLTRLQRLIMLFLVIVSQQGLYTLINRSIHGGWLPWTPLDARIPFVPAWVIIYDAWFFILVGAGIWSMLKMPDSLYRGFFYSAEIIILSAMAFYVIFPNYMQRPELLGNDWAVVWMRFIYANDNANNAFPSGHVYLIAIIGFYFIRWRPRSFWFWVITIALISVSTVLVKQHFILDVFGGFLWAYVGYRLGLKWARLGT